MQIDAGHVDAIFSAWDRSDSPGCALGIIRDGELVFARGYGMANLEHAIPITPDSIFHVASVSKQFAAMATMLLVDDGRLSLDDDVRRYAPEIPDFGVTITVRHLVHHTSGLRDQWSLLRMAGWRDDDSITEADVLSVSGRQKGLNFPPGDEYTYSNTGYTLLGLLVRRITGQSLREFCRERIFEPLGMTSTHFHDDHTEIVPGRTQSYAPRPAGGWFISMPVYDVVGATSLFTTVGDLGRWDANFTHGLVGGGAPLRMLQTPGRLNDGVPLTYAGGLSVGERRGRRAVEHSGGDFGYRAHFLRLPDERLSVVVLGNASTLTAGSLAWTVAETLLGGAPEPLASAPLSPGDAEARCGVYRHHASGEVVRATAAGGALRIGFEEGAITPLRPLGDGRYQHGDDDLITCAFIETGAGYAFHRRQPQDGGLPLVFERLNLEDRIDPAQFAGRYYSAELDVTWEFVLVDGRLVIRSRKFPDLLVQPLTCDLLVAESARVYGTLRFDVTRDVKRRVTGFRLGSARVRHLGFDRVS